MPPNTLTGEAMEAAVKHTYLCGSSEWHSEGTRISIAPHPFARGAMRASHRCCERVEEAGAVYSVEGVAKFSLIHGGEGAAKAAAFADARMQMVAEYWAQQFNRRSGNDAKLSFVVAQVLELPTRRGTSRWASLEPLLLGEYAKWNNNAGAVLGGPLAQAFSHFTVHESAGQMCVCDIQGVGGSLFTDPQIHARQEGFGDGNLGAGGIDRFLASHRCNEICTSLGLPKVEPKQRGGRAGPPVRGLGLGGHGRLDCMGGGGLAALGELMGRGMEPTHGMRQGVPRLLQQMMERALAARLADVQLQPPRHGGGGGHREEGRAMHAALRASDEEVARENERQLRAAIKASGTPGSHGQADLDLQRAIEASVKHRQQLCSRGGR